MSNFDFILKNKIFKTFAEASVEAEKSIAVTNVSCAIMCRRALELAVKWLYANDKELIMPYQDNLSSLVYDINFRNMIDENIFKEITYIIKGKYQPGSTGNMLKVLKEKGYDYKKMIYSEVEDK